MTCDYMPNGPFEHRRDSALERMTANFESRGFRVQRMDGEEGPLLAVKLPTMVGRIPGENYGSARTLELSNKGDGLTCLRVTQGYASAYNLKPVLSGPEIVAGGMYVTWISFGDKKK